MHPCKWHVLVSRYARAAPQRSFSDLSFRCMRRQMDAYRSLHDVLQNLGTPWVILHLDDAGSQTLGRIISLRFSS